MTIFVQLNATAVTDYTACYNWVVPDLPMVPIPMVLNAIRDATIELCERALLWRTELQQILVTAPTVTSTTAAAAIGAKSIVVADATNFNDTDTITVDLSDGTSWRGYVSGTPVNNIIDLDGPLNVDALSGAAVTKLVYLYEISVPTGTAIAKAIEAWLNDSVIDPISPDDLNNEFNETQFGWFGSNWRTDISLPTRWYMIDDTTVGLALAPSAQGVFRLNAALKPSRDSTTLPSWIFERYIETIAHGAKARLMAVPKKPYSDKEMATYHFEQFETGIGEARVRAARGNTRAPLRTHTVYNLR
jgi:hypothetical protein